MKKYCYIIITLFSCHIQHAQQYETNVVISKAENYLKEAVGDSLFKYFELDTNSYYEYLERNGETSWETLKKDT